MAADNATRRFLNTGIATGVVMLVSLFVAPKITSWNDHQMATQLVQQLETAEDSAVKIPLRQLEALGEAAIEPLIVAAASDRMTVATIARQIIDEKVTTLKLASAASTATRLDRESVRTTELLSNALARHINEFGPAGKRWAELLTLTMIELTDKLPAEQTRTLLENCSSILTSIPPRGRRTRTVGTSSLSVNPPQRDNLTTLPTHFEPLTRTSEKGLDALARIAPGKRMQTTKAALPSDTTIGFVPKRSSSALEWVPQETTTADALPYPALQAETEIHARTIPGSVHAQAGTTMGEVTDIPTPQAMADQAVRLQEATTEELFLRLLNATRYQQGVVRSVLMERGFVAAEIDLRLQLSSPNESDRLRFVDTVSRLPTSAASRTLRWLLQDDSGDVRLRALTALATTRSPEVVKLARELAVHDEDPRVARLAAKLIH